MHGCGTAYMQVGGGIDYSDYLDFIDSFEVVEGIEITEGIDRIDDLDGARQSRARAPRPQWPVELIRQGTHGVFVAAMASATVFTPSGCLSLKGPSALSFGQVAGSAYWPSSL